MMYLYVGFQDWPLGISGEYQLAESMECPGPEIPRSNMLGKHSTSWALSSFCVWIKRRSSVPQNKLVLQSGRSCSRTRKILWIKHDRYYLGQCWWRPPYLLGTQWELDQCQSYSSALSYLGNVRLSTSIQDQQWLQVSTFLSRNPKRIPTSSSAYLLCEVTHEFVSLTFAE